MSNDKIGEAHIYLFPDNSLDLFRMEQHKVSDYMHCYGSQYVTDWDNYVGKLKSMYNVEVKMEVTFPVLYDASPTRDPRIPKNVPSWTDLITEIGMISGTNIKTMHSRYRENRTGLIKVYTDLGGLGIDMSYTDAWKNSRDRGEFRVL